MVINEANPTPEMAVKMVSRIFKKQRSRWEAWEEEGPDESKNKVKVEPVDREPKADVRGLFSRKVHGRSASAIVSFWQKQIFSGRDAPPKQEASNQKVLDYVREHREAIGYVSSSVTLGKGVKELKINYPSK